MEDAPPSTPSSVEFGFVLRCGRGCGTYRHIEIHPDDGTVTSSQYEQPQAYKDYRKTRGTLGEVRLERLKTKGRHKGLRVVS
jgi:hypothetical protein